MNRLDRFEITAMQDELSQYLEGNITELGLIENVLKPLVKQIERVDKDLYWFVKVTAENNGDLLERWGCTKNRPQIVCRDGFKMSVQGSSGHYCIPRVSNVDRYSSMEVGYPSEEEPLIMEYVEDIDHPTNTVYAYVPIHLIQEVIDNHGGINLVDTFFK